MASSFRSSLAVLLLTLAPLAAARTPELAAKDAELLERFIAEAGLFDPRGARRVRTTVIQRDCWGNEGRVSAEGWAPAGDGHPPWLVCDDLARARVVPDVSVDPADFVEAMRAILAPKEGDEDQRRFGPFGPFGSPTVALGWAAWAHRLGHDDLAAELLALARTNGDRFGGRGDEPPPTPEQQLQAELAWGCYSTAVHAFMQRADEEALEAITELARLPGHGFKQAAALRRDLERRKEAGTLGAAGELPADLGTKPVAERVTILVRALEDVDARQWGQPGGVSLGSDARVQALIEVGEAAVPALIECLEQDERLTRSVHFWRDFARSRTVLTVREAALTALQAILQVREFEAASTGDSLSARGPAEARAAAARIRAYWEKNKGRSLEERMRATLLDPQASAQASRSAAWTLAGQQQRPGTMVFTGGSTSRERAAALALSEPTAAEAILVAYDREAARPADAEAHERTDLGFIPALASLGDARVAPALAERLKTATRPSLRVELALALDALGAPDALDGLATELAAGKLLHDVRSTGPWELTAPLGRLVTALAASDRPAREAALWALAEPAHPLFPVALDQALMMSGFRPDSSGWTTHPFCLRVLHAALAREGETGRKYRLENGSLRCDTVGGGQSTSTPPAWLDPARCEAGASSRWCDEAGARLGELLIGVPHHHALYSERDASLARVREAAGRLIPRARAATAIEAAALGVQSAWARVVFIPDLPPLEQAATPDDVAQGRAIFASPEGRNVKAAVRLPAMAEVKRQDGRVVPGLVVQAEVDPDGKRVFGVLTGDGGAQQLPASAVTKMFPLPTPAEHDAAAATLCAAVLAGDLDALGRYVDPAAVPRAALQEMVDELRKEYGNAPDELRAWAKAMLHPVPGGWRLGP